MYITPLDGVFMEVKTQIIEVTPEQAEVTIYFAEAEIRAFIQHPGFIKHPSVDYEKDWDLHVQVDTAPVIRGVQLYAVPDTNLGTGRIAISQIKLADDFYPDIIGG